MWRKPAIVTGAAAFLIMAAAFVTPAEAGPRAKNRVHTLMMNSGAEPAARGRIVVVQNRARTSVTIKVVKMTPGATYDVLVGGNARDHITTNAAGQGKVVHRARRASIHAAPLPYDPRGGSVEIASAGRVFLSADVPETPEECDRMVEIKLHLTPASGVGGEASAEFRERGGRMKFEVEIEDVLPGTYEVFVGGAKVGEIAVDGEGEGTLRFDSVPATGVDEDDSDDSMDQLLTFDPRGQLIEIQQSGTTVFSGTLPAAPSTGGSDDDDEDGDQDEHQD